MVSLYKVGGCVRDEIMGLKPKDIDYAVEASSYEEMRDYIATKGHIYVEHPEFFTIRAKVNGDDADFVLCRKEGKYSDGRRPDTVEIGDIYDDLSRRDFTMNAIAKREDGLIIDPHMGRQDIQSRTIRCVGSAEARFDEDALRILRAMRFAVTKNFDIDGQIYKSMKDDKILAKLIWVSEERIRDELNKCFSYDTRFTLAWLENFPLMKNVIFSRNLRLEATMKK